MYGKVKLTKKQIKEDKFTAFMFNAKQQITDSWQYYVIGLVVIVLIIAASIYYVDMQAKQSVEAADIYSKGVSEFRQKSYQNALLSLQLVLDDHGNTESAKDATFLLGDINLVTQNYPEAIRYFEMYIKKYSNDKLKVASSHAGIATAKENQGQFKEAAESFVKAYTVDPKGPLVGDYYISAMRNYLEAGDVTSAQVQLDSINKNYAGTNLASSAALVFAEKSR